MKKAIKFSVLSFAIVAIVSIALTPVYAATYTVSDTGGGSLSDGRTVSYANDWVLYSYFDYSGGSAKGAMVFGFDTVAINEDYCKAYHLNNTHKATVHNNTYGSRTSASASAGSWSQLVEVRHAAKPYWKTTY